MGKRACEWGRGHGNGEEAWEWEEGMGMGMGKGHRVVTWDGFLYTLFRSSPAKDVR